LPSFLLELVVVEVGSRLAAVEPRPDSPDARYVAGEEAKQEAQIEKRSEDPGLAGRVRAVLAYLAEEFVWARVVDPANGNNVVSEELAMAEKRAVQLAARRSLMVERWEQVLW